MSIVFEWRRRCGDELALLRGDGPERSRVNDVAKNAGRDIMQSRDRSREDDSWNSVCRSECVVGDVACGRVRDSGGGAACGLGCALALAFGSREAFMQAPCKRVGTYRKDAVDPLLHLACRQHRCVARLCDGRVARADESRQRMCRMLDVAGSFPLGRRLGLRGAGGVVCAAAHDHLGLARLPGDHCEGCEGLRGGRSVYKVPRGLPVWRNASRTRVDSPGARAAKYRGWANRQPAWDKRAQGDCADGRLVAVFGAVWALECGAEIIGGVLCAMDGWVQRSVMAVEARAVTRMARRAVVVVDAVCESSAVSEHGSSWY